MGRKRAFVLGFVAVACIWLPVVAASGATFTVGDLYLLTGGHPSPEIATGILRIVPDTGAVTSLGAMPLSAHSFCYDPYRGRLLGFLDHGAGGLLTVDADGVVAPLSPTLPGPWQIAPRGDGVLYCVMFGSNDFYYIDVTDTMHPLLDGAGALFSLGSEAYPKLLHFDSGTNSLLVFGGTNDNLPGCPDAAMSAVVRIPLSADGTRVEGSLATVQVDVSTTWEIPVGVSRAPGGGVLWVLDTNSNDLEPRMQLLNPAAMTCATFASNGPYTGAAATNAGTYSSRLGRAVILDTYHNYIRAFAAGGTGAGAIVAENVSDTGSGEVARLVEIWEATPTGVGATTAALATSIAAWPNPFNASVELGFRLDERASVDVAVYDLGGRRVRTLRSEALPAGDQQARWDGRDDTGRDMGAGTYFVRLRAGARHETVKIVYVK